MAQVVVVDDRDSKIHYAGGTWFNAGGPNESGGTTRGTRDAGSRATFTFTGTSVKIFGTVPGTDVSSIPPVSTYSIDGASSSTFAPTTGKVPVYKMLYYQSPPLQDGEHTLVITSLAKDSYFWLDYFEVTPSISKPPPPIPPPDITTTNVVVITSPPNPSPSAPVAPDEPKDTETSLPSTGAKSRPSNSVNSEKPTSPLGTSSPPEASTTPPFSASEEPSGTSTPLIASGSSQVPTSAIVGGALGGVIIFLIIFFLIWRCRRKATARYAPAHIETAALPWNRTEQTTRVTPFTMAENSRSALPVAVSGAPRDQLAYDDGQEGRSTALGTRAPSYGYGYGYITHGGTSSEKTGLHSASSPSHSHSRSITDSATGLVSVHRDPSEASSQYGGSASSAVPRPTQHDQLTGPGKHFNAGPHISNRDTFPNAPPPPQSYGAGSLYHALEEDTPPAYQSTPTEPNPKTG